MNRSRVCVSLLSILITSNLIPLIYCSTEPVPECSFLYELTSPEPQYRGFFGSCSILLNDTILIGEPGPYREKPSSGAVHFFDLDGNLTRSLRSPFNETGSYFGYAMTTCGDLLLIGDPGASVDGVESAGMVYVYTLEGEYLRSLSSYQPSLDGEFGRSLASNDLVILIGEPGPQTMDENVTSRVHVYGDECEYLFTIQRSEARTGCFGMSLAVNNDTIIIGEPYLSVRGAGWQGIAYLYNLDGGYIRNITSPFYATTFKPRNFGFRISANDNLIAIGEVRGDVEDHESAGRAYIYDRNGDLLTNLTSLEPAGFAGFGYLLVWRDLVLVNDYVRVEDFPDRLGAVIYDEYGAMKAVVSSRDYEWVRGYPIAFNDDLIVLGDVIGYSSGVQYAGNAYVVRVPQEIWEKEIIVGGNELYYPLLILLGAGLLLLIIFIKQKTDMTRSLI